MLSAVIDSVAFPGAVGFLITLAVKLDDLHLIVRFKLPVRWNTALVPFTRLAWSFAPDLTAVPWTFLMVSTWEWAAGAASATIGAARTAAEAVAMAR